MNIRKPIILGLLRITGSKIPSNLKTIKQLEKNKENDEDVSVCETLREIKPDAFANGGDRKQDNIPEYKLCEELGIKMIFNVGGNKIRSSSDLVKDANDK